MVKLGAAPPLEQIQQYWIGSEIFDVAAAVGSMQDHTGHHRTGVLNNIIYLVY